MQTNGARLCEFRTAAPPGHRATAIDAFLTRYSLLFCLILVGIACARIVSTDDSLAVTPDEPFHLACAIEYLTYHTVTLSVENPPIAQAIEGIGPYFAGVRLAGRADPFVEGADILTRSGNEGGMIFRLRLGTLPFFLLACCVVGLWAYHFFGRATAVIAVALYTLLPSTLTDAGLGTTDMALAATTGASFWAAIRWAEKPTSLRATLLGFLVALALLSKFSALGYISSSLVLAVLGYWFTTRMSWRNLLPLARRYHKTFALAIATTLFFVWAAYWFSFEPISGYSFRLPAPEYLEGLYVALSHNRNGHSAYLLGQHNIVGWWYYFPVALAVKTPIAFLIFVVIGGILCFRQRAALSYLLPFAFVLGVLLPAMVGRIDIGIRHIAPVYLGLSIIAALGVMQLMHTGRFRALACSAAMALLLWMIASVGVQHPDYLAYFNGFAGSHPENILVDSNYDWGQDLKLLSRRLHQLNADHVALGSLDGAFRDRYRQDWYGIPHIVNLDDATPTPGWTAVSASFDKSYRFTLAGRRSDATPWYDRIAPTERLGPYFLYYVSSGGATPEQNAPHP